MKKHILVLCLAILGCFSLEINNRYSIQLATDRQNILEFTGAQVNDRQNGNRQSNRRIDIQNDYKYKFTGLPSWMVSSGNRLQGRPPVGVTGVWPIKVSYSRYSSSVFSGSDLIYLKTPNRMDTDAGNEVRYAEGRISGGVVIDNIYCTNTLVVFIPYRGVETNFQGALNKQLPMGKAEVPNSPIICSILESKYLNAENQKSSDQINVNNKRNIFKYWTSQVQESKTYKPNIMIGSVDFVQTAESTFKKEQKKLIDAQKKSDRADEDVKIAQAYRDIEDNIKKTIQSAPYTYRSSLGTGQQPYNEIYLRQADQILSSLRNIASARAAELQRAKSSYESAKRTLPNEINNVLGRYSNKFRVGNSQLDQRDYYDDFVKLSQASIQYISAYADQNQRRRQAEMYKTLLSACRSPRKTNTDLKYGDPSCEKQKNSSLKGSGKVEYSNKVMIQVGNIRLYVGKCASYRDCGRTLEKSQTVDWVAQPVAGRLWLEQLTCRY